MNEEVIFVIVAVIGIVAILGTCVVCEIMTHNDENSTNVSVKHSNNDESHAIIPISTGSSTTYIIC